MNSELELRSLIHEMLQETGRAGGGTIYSDNAGYKFRIDNGKLMLVARPKSDKNGQAGLPKPLNQKIVASTAAELSRRYPQDKALSALAKGGSAGGASTPAPSSGVEMNPQLRQDFPNFKFESLISKQVVVVGTTQIEACSAWAGQYVGKIGNAWHAHSKGSLKYDAFSNFQSYKGSVEALLSKMNGVAGLNDTSSRSFNAAAQKICLPLVPAPSAPAGSMELGDIVGMYHPGSSHYAEALFDSATGYKIARAEMSNVSPGVTVDGVPWSPSMLGQKGKKFVLTRPIGFNTHVGFVGAIYNGQPVVFHNVSGNVLASIASKMNVDKPVWVKGSGFFSGFSMPDFGGMFDSAKKALGF